MMNWRACVLLLIACIVAPGAGAQGVSGSKMPASLTLHSGWTEPDGSRIAGIRMELEPGWKTYWRSPGESGIPPHFDWTGSENLKDATVSWPAPVAFDTLGSRTIGYKGRVVLPLTLTPTDPAKPIRVRLSMFYGICDDICIPASDDFAMDIAPGAAIDGGVFIRNALASMPLSATKGGLTRAECSITGATAERAFDTRLTFSPPLSAPPVIIAEGPEGVWFGSVEALADGTDIVGSGRVRLQEGSWIDRSAITLTILPRKGQALSLTGCTSGG